MSNNKPIRRVSIIGTGVIGASWTALFLAKGLEVVATDVAPNAEAALKRFIDAAWPALKRLGLAPGASQSKLKFTADLATAVKGADLVQENGPERIDFKKKLYRELDELLPPDVIIASSSSGLTMSEIQSACESHPERRPRSRGRFITWLRKEWSAQPTSTPRCAGDRACGGASWAT
jgi:3-hydroxyacyl-CoA dehydrogenase